MPKRFTTTEKWSKPWHQELEPRLKCFWDYICSNCNPAGIWDVNLPLASFQVGAQIRKQDLSKYGGKIVALKNGKWFVVGFIEFQYGSLNPSVAPHKGVIKILEKNEIPLKDGLPTLSKGLSNPSLGLQEKEKVQEKEKDKEGGVGEGKKIPPELETVKLQCAKIGLPDLEAQAFIDFYDSNGWKVGKNPMRSWPSALANWKRRWESHRYAPTNGKPTKTPPGIALKEIQRQIKAHELSERIPGFAYSPESEAEFKRLKARESELSREVMGI